MADPIATVLDVQTLAPAVTLDNDQVEALLRLASAKVRAFTGCPFDTLPHPDGLVELVANMALRAVQNPLGVTQETTGPHSVSYGSSAANKIYLTAEDKMFLGDISCKPRLRTISTTRGPVETPTPDDFHIALSDDLSEIVP